MNDGQSPKNGPKSATAASMEGHAALGAGQLALAWAAGFADGEACIHIAKQRYGGIRRDTYRLGVHVTQNDRGVLESFCKAVGIEAPIYAVKRAANHTRQCYTLNYSGRGAMELLTLLMPFLRRKRREAEVADEFWTRARASERPGARGLDPEIAALREHFFQLMKRLK